MSQGPVPMSQGKMGKSQCPSAHNPMPKLARDEHSAQSPCPKAQWPGIFGKKPMSKGSVVRDYSNQKKERAQRPEPMSQGP